MGELREFSLSIRLFLKTYRWRRIDPVPWAPLRRPLSQSRLALITTAGFTLPEHHPFDEEIRGGDSSYREIPDDTPLNTLSESHRSESFDHTGIGQDPNLAFPLDRVHELVTHGRLGCTNHRHFSFMGSITAPGRLLRQSAPEAAAKLAEDEVDLALLVPV